MQRTQAACSTRAAVPPGPLVEIRPTVLDDVERVQAFLAGLSLDTQTQRFFTGISRPGARLVTTLITRDDRRDALLAIVDETVVGHAMSYTKDGRAEIAVVVDDAWQGLGIGSRLVRSLLTRASAGGVATVGMDVLGGNRRVLSMIRRAWPDATMRIESGTVEVVADIIFAEQRSVTSPLTV